MDVVEQVEVRGVKEGGGEMTLGEFMEYFKVSCV